MECFKGIDGTKGRTDTSKKSYWKQSCSENFWTREG